MDVQNPPALVVDSDNVNYCVNGPTPVRSSPDLEDTNIREHLHHTFQIDSIIAVHTTLTGQTFYEIRVDDFPYNVFVYSENVETTTSDCKNILYQYNNSADLMSAPLGLPVVSGGARTNIRVIPRGTNFQDLVSGQINPLTFSTTGKFAGAQSVYTSRLSGDTNNDINDSTIFVNGDYTWVVVDIDSVNGVQGLVALTNNTTGNDLGVILDGSGSLSGYVLPNPEIMNRPVTLIQGANLTPQNTEISHDGVTTHLAWLELPGLSHPQQPNEGKFFLLGNDPATENDAASLLAYSFIMGTTMSVNIGGIQYTTNPTDSFSTSVNRIDGALLMGISNYQPHLLYIKTSLPSGGACYIAISPSGSAIVPGSMQILSKVIPGFNRNGKNEKVRVVSRSNRGALVEDASGTQRWVDFSDLEVGIEA